MLAVTCSSTVSEGVAAWRLMQKNASKDVGYTRWRNRRFFGVQLESFPALVAGIALALMMKISHRPSIELTDSSPLPGYQSFFLR
jgi:hypothetical protein